MNCNEARKFVSQFIDDEMSIKESEQFLRHVENCPDCRDELDIYYTMSKALDLIDSNERETFDFQKLLKTQIHVVKRRIHRRKLLHFVRRSMLIVTELLLLLAIYMSAAHNNGLGHDHRFSFLEWIHSEEVVQEEETDG